MVFIAKAELEVGKGLCYACLGNNPALLVLKAYANNSHRRILSKHLNGRVNCLEGNKLEIACCLSHANKLNALGMRIIQREGWFIIGPGKTK